MMTNERRGKFDINEALDNIDLSFSNYTPSEDALEFFALIKVFMGEDFETPNCKFHYFIVDMLFGKVKREDFPYSEEINSNIPINPSRVGVIAARGSAKSTITTTFYPIYCAIKGKTPYIKNISHILILSDSQQGGARDQAKLLGGEFKKSKFAHEYFDMEKSRFTESEVELIRKGSGPIEKRHMLIKFKGAQANPLDHMLFTDNGRVSIGDVKVGQQIIGADGKLTTVIGKSEIFNKPMYRIHLKDGRTLDVSDNHINSIMYLQDNYDKAKNYYKEMNVTTKELLSMGLWKTNKTTGYTTPKAYIKNCKPVNYSTKKFPVDPYTLGLLIGDGYYHIKDGSAKLVASVADFGFYKDNIPYDVGYVENKGTKVTATIKGAGIGMKKLGLSTCSASTKFIPEEYQYGSIEQRLALLQGLIDTDGTIGSGNQGSMFMTTSKQLADDVSTLVRSLGGTVTRGISNYASDDEMVICGTKSKRNYDVIRLYIKLNMEVAKLPRKNKLLSYKQKDEKVAIIDIEEIPTVPSQCIAVDNDEHQYLVQDYVRTHNTGGIRSGSRNPVTRDRYAIIIGDDVIKNETEAYSETIMRSVDNALNSDALNAMRSKNTQMVLINTPFNESDPIYKNIQSGTFTPLVAPICESINENMTKEEFRPLWKEMHDYESVMERYLNAVGTNSTRSFNQELMLRVASEEDRIVTDDMIQWYDRNLVVKMISGYKLYMTTDFTTTSEAKSDYSAIALWAVSSNNDYFLLDLCLRKQGLSEQYNEVFRMIATWGNKGPIEVGVEIDGQQKAHLFTLKEMMIKKNIFFSFARQKGASHNQQGIRSGAAVGNKLDRFRYVVPLLQNKKFWFPEQLKDTPEMKQAIKQLKGATHSGFTTHDDFNDCLSQLGLIDILPGSGSYYKDDTFGTGGGYWDDIVEDEEEDINSLIF